MANLEGTLYPGRRLSADMNDKCIFHASKNKTIQKHSTDIFLTRQQYASEGPEDLEPAQHGVAVSQREKVPEVGEDEPSGPDDAEAGEESGRMPRLQTIGKQATRERGLTIISEDDNLLIDRVSVSFRQWE